MFSCIKLLSSEGSIEQQLKRLEEEVKTNAYLVERLPQVRRPTPFFTIQEVEEKKEWCERLRRVLSEPTLTEGEKNKLQNQIQALRMDIKKLIAKRDAVNK